MCGINGLVSTSPMPDAEATVARMNRRLAYRGPDDDGVTGLGWGAVGMQRLAIVDLAHGRQPMASADGRYVIVFNGEIYDYKLLRDSLQSQGVSFRTSSDTEVLLNVFIRDGISGLGQLNGMFGFAIVDRQERSLTIVRDRVGIKPLYYYRWPSGDLAFSSEIGALLANTQVPRRLDQDSLRSFLVDRFVADPYTFFDGVRQLPPGSWLKWKDGEFETGRYWIDEVDSAPLEEEATGEDLQELLAETIRSQMVADVPVGVFLSGGIDSSTVAAFAAETSSGPLHTFSVGFSDSQYDESKFAAAVARRLGTHHHEMRVQDSGYDPQILSKIVRHVGQPVGDTSCIPMLYLSEFTAQHVKVALSGDGGDEYFGGYNHIEWAAKVARISRLPLASLRVFSARLLTDNDDGLLVRAVGKKLARQLRKGLHCSLLEPRRQLRNVMSLWTPEQTSTLLPGCAGDIRATYETIYEQFAGLGDKERIMRVLAHTYMPGAILTKVDRMSMAASLEVRVPLLDNRITDFARRLPLAQKIRGGTGKFLLREAGRARLPDSIYSHPKQGFSIPLAKWLNEQFWDQLEVYFASGEPLAELFDRDALMTTFQDGRAALQDSARLSGSAAAARVWVLALLGCWFDQYDVSL